MRRFTLQSLLGPALLSYLIADAASSQGRFDPLGAAFALVALLLTLAPRLLVHDPAAQGARAVGLLGLCLSMALVRVIAPRAMTLTGDLVEALALGGATGIVTLLAGYESALGPRRRRALAATAGLLATSMGFAAALPPPSLGSLTLIAPSWWAQAPIALFACSVAGSTLLRFTRLYTGTPSSQAAQSWVLLGLLPANGALVLLAVGGLDGGGLTSAGAGARLDEAARGACVLAAWLLTWGHGAALDPDRRLLAGSVARRAAAFLLVLGGALIALRALHMLLAPFLVELPFELSIAIALCLAAVLRPIAEHGAMSLLAPAQGRLLRAVDRAHDQLGYVSSLESVAQVVLSALRGSASEDSFGASLETPTSPSAGRALLYRTTPACEIELDAAGQAHKLERALHPEIERALRARPETLVRAALEAKIVREPPLRPLIAALIDLDALCVVPLIHDGELEGALVVPRAGRTRALTLEELAALDGLARHIAGFLSVLASEARAHERAERAFIDARLAETTSEEAAAESERLRRELRALHDLPRQDVLEQKPIAYSTGMRALLASLAEHAASDTPLWITAERGVETAPLAQYLHDRSVRCAQPLVVIACSSAAADDGDAFLARVLQAGEGGTILLRDVTALPLEAQRAVARLALAAGGSEGMPRARVIVEARSAPDVLAQGGALAHELIDAFPSVLSAPPLRARREDLPSLVLLALDRAARVLGRAPVGIDAEAQARLLAHDFALNAIELQAVIERAAAACSGPRIDGTGIALALGLSERAAREELALDGTFERIERRVLKRALDRTNGNKSEAARLLGLPRTTFIDKLRRHNLDEKGTSTPPLRSAG